MYVAFVLISKNLHVECKVVRVVFYFLLILDQDFVVELIWNVTAIHGLLQDIIAVSLKVTIGCIQFYLALVELMVFVGNFFIFGAKIV